VEGKTRFIWITHKSAFLDEEVVSCLMQVLDKYGRPMGIIGLDIKLSQLSELVRGSKIGKNGVSMILDMDNKIVAHTDVKNVGQYICNSQLNISQKNLSEKSSIMKINNKKFKCKVSQVKKLPWKWNIISAIPVDEITCSIMKSISLFIVFSIVGFTIAFIMYLKNKATRNYLSIVEELAISNERNRMARDVHDTLGQTLSLLMTLLQVSIISCREDSTKTENNLNNAIRITQEGFKEIRRSILSDTSSQKWEGNYLFDELEKLISEYEGIGISVDLSVNKIGQKIDGAYSKTIYRICQEALTNSLKHGKATEVSIIIKFSEKAINIFIFDNGVGCKNINSENGFGLKAMKQRVDNLKGIIKYGSDGENGFNINVELPIDNRGENYD
jgi:signal transduction histidine kinase